MYHAAVQQYNQGMLSTAQSAFQNFLDTYPNHALAPEVHFDLGDILEQQGDTTGALAQFKVIPSNFPTADQAPDAMYRIARVDLARKHTKDAKAMLQRIVNTYPGTDAAKLAKAELDKLGG
jgi:tol-pal system protein YbgF